MFLADAVVETHDRIVGGTYREAARTCEAQLGDETAAVRGALRAFAELSALGESDTPRSDDDGLPRARKAAAGLEVSSRSGTAGTGTRHRSATASFRPPARCCSFPRWDQRHPPPSRLFRGRGRNARGEQAARGLSP